MTKDTHENHETNVLKKQSLGCPILKISQDLFRIVTRFTILGIGLFKGNFVKVTHPSVEYSVLGLKKSQRIPNIITYVNIITLLSKYDNK